MEDGRFCAVHGEVLARIREELDEKGKRYGNRNATKKKPVCCNPACDSPRKRGESFCFECGELAEAA